MTAILTAYDRSDALHENLFELVSTPKGLVWTCNGFVQSPLLANATTAKKYAKLTGLTLRNRKRSN
jgi:hypothetical protein